MKSSVRPDRPTPVTVTLELSEDEFFYLWALTYTKSNGTPYGLRDRFERGVYDAMDAATRSSVSLARAKEAVLNRSGPDFTSSVADTVNDALAKARTP